MGKKSISTYETVAEIAFALSHPARVKIIELLSSNRLRLKDISESLNLTPATTTQHLLVLRRANLIHELKEGKWGKTKYYIISEANKDRFILYHFLAGNIFAKD